MKKERKEYEILSVSRKYVLVLYAIMLVGTVMCVLSFFNTIGSFDTRFIGFFGAPLVFVGIGLQMLTIKCPYCGKKRVGRAIGMKLNAEIKCPDCNKKLRIK